MITLDLHFGRQPADGVSTRRIIRNQAMLCKRLIRHPSNTIVREQLEELNDEVKYRNDLVKRVHAGLPDHFICSFKDVMQWAMLPDDDDLPTDGAAE